MAHGDREGHRIRLDQHTLARARERGTDEREIFDVIRTGFSIEAHGARLGKGKVYPFDRERHGKVYEEKRVEVIYTMDDGELVTVTVYVFYGKWEAGA